MNSRFYHSNSYVRIHTYQFYCNRGLLTAPMADSPVSVQDVSVAATHGKAADSWSQTYNRNFIKPLLYLSL